MIIVVYNCPQCLKFFDVEYPTAEAINAAQKKGVWDDRKCPPCERADWQNWE